MIYKKIYDFKIFNLIKNKKINSINNQTRNVQTQTIENK